MIVEQLKAIFTLDSTGFTAGMKKAQKDLDSAKVSTNKMSSSVSDLNSSLGSLAGSVAKIGAIFGTVGAVAIGTTLKLANMSAEIESLNNGLKFALGGARQGADAFKFLATTSDRLGISLQKSAGAFKSMAAAARNTSLEGEGVLEIYTALAEATAVVGLSQAQAERVFYAVQQMMSKGVISAEEFRQQLGEHLPMATATMAKALGVTTAELNKMMSMGVLMAEDVLPAFAKQLRTDVADAVEDAGGSIRASLARLSNAWYLAKKEIFEGGEATVFLQVVVDGITAAVKKLPEYWLAVEGAILGTARAINYVRNALSSVLTLSEGMDQLISFPDIEAPKIKETLKAEIAIEPVLDARVAIDAVSSDLTAFRDMFKDKFSTLSRDMKFETDVLSLGINDDFERAALIISRKADERIAQITDVYSKIIKTLGDNKEKELALTEEYDELIAQVQLTADKELGAARIEQLQKNQDDINRLFEKNYGSIIGFVESSTKRITDVLVDLSFGGKTSFKEMTDSILKDMQRLIYQIFVIEPIIKGFRKLLQETIPSGEGLLGIFSGEGNGGSLIGSLLGFAKNIFGFANGGMIQEPIAGIGLKSGNGYTFGESGNEMVTPAGAGASQNITVNINALDSKSLVELMDSNPQAVLSPLVGALQAGDRGVTTAMRGAM